MIKNTIKSSKDVIIILFLCLGFFFLFFHYNIKSNIDIRTFLTLTTFLFAIFSGFFIARQGTRYGVIRDLLTKFDGNMSFIFRVSGCFDKKQKEIIDILKNHYTPILKTKAWYYFFTRKTTTLTDLHSFCETMGKRQNLKSIENIALTRIIVSLRECQYLRKNLLALHGERVPQSQWSIIILLVIVLLFSLLLIPTQADIIGSFLKGIFAALIIFVLIFLKRLDKLIFFEKTIGENSAQDVLDIIEGKR